MLLAAEFMFTIVKTFPSVWCSITITRTEHAKLLQKDFLLPGNYKHVLVKCWSWNCQITSQQIEKQIYKIIKNKLNNKVIWDQLIIMLFQC